MRRGRCRGGSRRLVPHPVSQPEAQPAQEQKAEDNPQLRSRAQRYLGVVPALLEFLNFGFFVVKISAHILASTAIDFRIPGLTPPAFAGRQTDRKRATGRRPITNRCMFTASQPASSAPKTCSGSTSAPSAAGRRSSCFSPRRSRSAFAGSATATSWVAWPAARPHPPAFARH